MRLLQDLQTRAADRWSFIEHPRLRRVRLKPKRDWVGAAFKGTIFGALMWWIWAPVLLALLIVAITIVG